MIPARMPARILLPAALVVAALLPPAAAAGERVAGKIVFSDGTVLAGDIRTTEGKPLRLIEAGTARRLDLALPEVYRIRCLLVSEEEYRVWRWVEDGSREKVYTGETYPKREFEAEVVLRNGDIRRGTLVGVLYVYETEGAKPKRAILKDLDQGEVGEKLTDRVYVESVTFEGPPPEIPPDASIRLLVTPPEELVVAHAVPRERDRSVQGLPGAAEGEAVFTGLLPGTYDLVLFTERRVCLSLAAGAGGAPADEKTLAEIAARVREIPDFFTRQEVLAAARDGDKVRALVYATRSEPSTMGGERTFRRWELWAIRRGGDRWLVDSRMFLFRDHGEGLPAPPAVTLVAGLGGVRVDEEGAVVRFAVPGTEDE